MSFEMNLWKILDNDIKAIDKSKLSEEERLENWIVSKPEIIGIEILIIGRQVTTQFGGRIDLLGIDAQGDTIILELKRDKTPREVVAQILDYGSWVKELSYDSLNSVCSGFLKKELSEVFRDCYGYTIPEDINSAINL